MKTLLFWFCLLVQFVLRAQTITQAEYFIDTDPGLGNGFVIGITQADSINASFNVPLTSVNSGFHVLYVRVKDSNNKWSLTQNTPFYKDNITVYSNITRLEYFIDNDPGIGNATPISVSANPSVATSITIPLNSVTSGFHVLYLRAKDANGYWSITQNTPFYKDNITVYPNITRLEYFIDNDPGIGNASPISVSANPTINASINIPLNTVSSGFHILYVRAKDANGHWSITQNTPFFKDNLIDLPNLKSAEYFIDTDPGMGNATAIATASEVSINQNFIASLSGISYGSHTFYIRVKDSLNHWSLTQTKSFTVCNLPSSPTLLGSSSYNVGNGGSLSFSVTPASGASIFWRGPNGFTSTSNTVSLINILANKAGTYNAYSVTGATSCDTSLATAVEVVIVNYIQMNLKAYLQGLYLGNGQMIASPFVADGITPQTIADTITVELRNTTGAYSVAYSTKATLDIGGNAIISFPSATLGNSYYIVVNHRNSIATWSANPVNISSNTSYDFTTDMNSSAGNNLVSDGASNYLIFSGDINQDGSVDFNDYPDLDIASSNGVLGYDPNDLNGDGSVDFNDYPIIDINSSNGVLAITP